MSPVDRRLLARAAVSSVTFAAAYFLPDYFSTDLGDARPLLQFVLYAVLDRLARRKGR